MIAAVAMARSLRRRQRVADSLALGCIVLLLLDPLAVLGAGFWLSFAGVAWLLWSLPAETQQRPWPLLRSFVAAQAVHPRPDAVTVCCSARRRFRTVERPR